MSEHMFARAEDAKGLQMHPSLDLGRADAARAAIRSWDYFFATTMVLIVAVAFSTTSTTTM